MTAGEPAAIGNSAVEITLAWLRTDASRRLPMPSRRSAGATAIIGAKRWQLMLCDNIFSVVSSHPAPVDIKTLEGILCISDVRRQLESNAIGTSPTM